MRNSLLAPVACACAVLCAGCATSSSVSTAFKGEEHAVAEAVASLQSAATASENKKICSQLLTKANVKALGGLSACEAAVKSQLGQIDSFEVATKAVHVDGDQATATVESVVAGKKTDQTVKLVKEDGSWRIDELQ